MGHVVHLTLDVPEEVSGASRERALRQAHEVVVLTLWQDEQISTRVAAEELGMTYREFLDLLAARGIPVVDGSFDMEPIEAAQQKLASGRP